MASIDRQKALADRVAEKLEEVDVFPLLAGGAPRDWYVGVAANDLDFYIQADNPEATVLLVAHQLDTKLNPLGDDKYNKLLRDEPSLLAVYEGDFHGQAVQFMFTSVPPKQFVKEMFDLSICKVWYEEGEIGMDWEARLSFREKVIVLENWGEFPDKIMERAEWSHYKWRLSWKAALMLMGHNNGNRRVGLFGGLEVEEAVVENAVNPANGIEMPGPMFIPERAVF